MTNVQRLQKSLRDSDVQALFLTDLVNIQWLTGFRGSSGLVLLTADEGLFITDSRYKLSSQAEVQGLPV
ncbi:MAG: aminopeptidase P family N-terminal domain-containing protein, partial [Fimbriimonadaceae bacterium]|nr:aminopeptidase P family N-terminal domain-containing protein [Fimbriimonadaceae bacterium]